MNDLDMKPDRLTNGGNGAGRGLAGRFAVGNAGGPGNPHAKRVAELRRLLVETVSDDDLKAVVGALVAKARGGDLGAIKELLDRIIGRPVQPVVAEASPAPLFDWNAQVKVTPEQQQRLSDFRDRMRQLTDKG